MRKNQKKYIVTGGAGFIGSTLAERLVREGHRVVVVDNLYAGFESFVPEGASFVNVDISDWNALSRCFPDFQLADGVFHLAACSRIQPSIKDPSLTNDYNVTGTMNILQMMRMCNIPSIVYSGSSSYYGDGAKLPCHESDEGNPETPYAITKYMGEQYCQTWSKIYGTRCAILRYFNVYGRRSPLTGPYAPVIGLFFRQGFQGEDITVVGDGEQRRDFTHVGDVATANICAMDALAGPDWPDVDKQVFNIGTGKNNSINEVATMVADTLQGTANIVWVPQRAGEARETLADSQRAQNVLDWKPTVSIEEGVRDLYSYYSNNLEALKAGRYDF